MKKQLVSEQTISGTQAMNSASPTPPLMSLSLTLTPLSVPRCPTQH